MVRSYTRHNSSTLGTFTSLYHPHFHTIESAVIPPISRSGQGLSRKATSSSGAALGEIFHAFSLIVIAILRYLAMLIINPVIYEMQPPTVYQFIQKLPLLLFVSCSHFNRCQAFRATSMVLHHSKCWKQFPMISVSLGTLILYRYSSLFRRTDTFILVLFHITFCIM